MPIRKNSGINLLSTLSFLDQRNKLNIHKMSVNNPSIILKLTNCLLLINSITDSSPKTIDNKLIINIISMVKLAIKHVIRSILFIAFQR